MQPVKQSVNAGLIGLTMIGLTTTAMAQDSLTLSAGYDFSRGDYGQTVDTEITGIPVTLQYSSGAINWKLTLPYLQISGNGTVVPGPGGPISFNDFSSGFFGGGFGPGSSGASVTQSVTQSGFGDVTASVGFAMQPANGNYFEFSGKIKLATADESKGLGTGENDYYLQYDAVLNAGEMLPMFTLGYVITGDSASTRYNDVFYGSAGMMLRTGHHSTIGLVYDFRQTTLDGRDDLKMASIFLNWKATPLWSAAISAGAGFSDSSPDNALNITLTRRF